MKRSRLPAMNGWMSPSLLMVVLLFGVRTVAGQVLSGGQELSDLRQKAAEPSTDESAAAKPTPDATVASPKKKFRGRLPAYFGQVVDRRQREQIYAIQKEYFEEIEALKARLTALTSQRDQKVLAVLKAEQRAQVEQLQAEAKAKRSSKRTSKKE